MVNCALPRRRNLNQLCNRAPYIVDMVDMKNVDKWPLLQENHTDGRELATHLVLPNGYELLTFGTHSGFEIELWNPGGTNLFARWWTDADGKFITSNTRPFIAYWDKNGKLAEFQLSTTDNQIEDYFARNSDPLLIGCLCVGGQLRPKIHLEKDKNNGQILRIETGYFPSGKVKVVKTYHHAELLSHLEYNEEGNLIVER